MIQQLRRLRNPNFKKKNEVAPPPDNFPDGWESEWQPSFENTADTSTPKPVIKRKEETTREALVTSIGMPLAREDGKDIRQSRSR